MNSFEVLRRPFNPIKESESCSVISPSWREILGQLLKLVMGCNISISSSNLKDFIDSLVVSCIWQINNHKTVIYLCILFHKAHSAKRLKKIFCLHSSSSFFSLLQAHPHPNPTWWVSHHSSPLNVCCSTPSWPLFSEYYDGNSITNKETKLLKHSPKALVH